MNTPNRTAKPKITAVIITWNSRGVVEPCVESLFANAGGEDLDVVIVDNASRDSSHLELLESTPRVTVVRNRSNEGYAKAANRGLSLSDSEYCLIMNPDIRFNVNPFPRLFAELRADPSIGAIAPLLRDDDGLPQKAYYQKLPGAIQYLLLNTYFAKFACARAMAARHFQSHLPTRGACVVEQLPGAFLLFRRDLFEAGTWMNEAFFLWMEDVEFCARVRAAGKHCVVVADESVVHTGGASFKLRENDWKRRVFTDSYITFLDLHASWMRRTATLSIMLADAGGRALSLLARMALGRAAPAGNAASALDIVKLIARRFPARGRGKAGGDAPADD